MYKVIPRKQTNFSLVSILLREADAIAIINGSSSYPLLTGMVRFYQTDAGVIVYSEISGLPAQNKNSVFGYHIHEGSSCSGDSSDPFSAAKAHYNPDSTQHPFHAGDLPPLFGCNGTALSLFLTDRFSVEEILGRTVIIHGQPDDFTTQPSGNAGKKIGCGIIR